MAQLQGELATAQARGSSAQQVASAEVQQLRQQLDAERALAAAHKQAWEAAEVGVAGCWLLAAGCWLGKPMPVWAFPPAAGCWDDGVPGVEVSGLGAGCWGSRACTRGLRRAP
jgi:hypothetical protein